MTDDLDPETRADLDQLWYAIENYMVCPCDDGCENCNHVEVDAVRATVAYQRIQAKLKQARAPSPEPTAIADGPWAAR